MSKTVTTKAKTAIIHPILVVANPATTKPSITRTRTSQKDSKAESINGRSQGSEYGSKKAPEQEVNHSIFRTVSASTAGIFLKMYVGIRHLFL
jgi:hypothetical protein